MTSKLLLNISVFPRAVQPLITGFSHKLIEKLGDDVRSILVYGSAAGVSYNPLVSNLNVAVIFKDLDFLALNKSLDLIKWGHKRRISTPLFLTKEYIQNSLDVFPIEFSEIKDQHKIVYGEDVFGDLQIPVKDIRLLCEQQVKGKLLQLRQAYLDIGSRPPILKALLGKALNDLIPIFRQLIILKGQKSVEQKEEMLAILANEYSLDLQIFLTIYHDKHKKTTILTHQVEIYLQNFLIQLEKLSHHLDSL